MKKIITLILIIFSLNVKSQTICTDKKILSVDSCYTKEINTNMVMINSLKNKQNILIKLDTTLSIEAKKEKQIRITTNKNEKSN